MASAPHTVTSFSPLRVYPVGLSTHHIPRSPWTSAFCSFPASAPPLPLAHLPVFFPSCVPLQSSHWFLHPTPSSVRGEMRGPGGPEHSQSGIRATAKAVYQACSCGMHSSGPVAGMPAALPPLTPAVFGDPDPMTQN